MINYKTLTVIMGDKIYFVVLSKISKSNQNVDIFDDFFRNYKVFL